jgi:hemin uptake protein HemP
MSPDETKKTIPATHPRERAPSPVRYAVSELLRGGREAILEHNGCEYHLRITANGRLILTK